MRIGQYVNGVFDFDGAKGHVGVVQKVYRSGRCLVQFPNGSLRNLKKEWLRVTANQNSESSPMGINGVKSYGDLPD